MRPTLLILIAIALGLLIWTAVSRQSESKSPKAVEFTESDIQLAPPPSYLSDPPEGGFPTEDADITVHHDVIEVGPQHRLRLYLTEEHGWWVDRISVNFWYRSQDPDTGEWIDHSSRNHFIPQCIPFGETLEHEFVIFETDFPQGMPKGTADNWGVRILKWDQERVRIPPTP